MWIKRDRKESNEDWLTICYASIICQKHEFHFRDQVSPTNSIRIIWFEFIRFSNYLSQRFTAHFGHYNEVIFCSMHIIWISNDKCVCIRVHICVFSCITFYASNSFIWFMIVDFWAFFVLSKAEYFVVIFRKLSHCCISYYRNWVDSFFQSKTTASNRAQKRYRKKRTKWK